MPLVAQINPPVLNTPGGVIQSPTGLNGTASNLGGDKLQLYGTTISPQQVPALQGGQTIVGGHIAPLQTPNTLIGVQNPNGSITINSAGGSGSWNGVTGVTGVGPWNPGGGGGGTPPDTGEEEEEEEQDDDCFTPTLTVTGHEAGDCDCKINLLYNVSAPNPSVCECKTSIELISPTGSCSPGDKLIFKVRLTYNGECGDGSSTTSYPYMVPLASNNFDCNSNEVTFSQGFCPCDVDVDFDLPDGATLENIDVFINNSPSASQSLIQNSAIDPDYYDIICNEYENTTCVVDIGTSLNMGDLLGDACNGNTETITVSGQYYDPETEQHVIIYAEYDLPDPPTGPFPDGEDCNFDVEFKTDETSLLSNSNNLVDLVSISPNPASDMVNIDLPEAAVDQFVNVQISDLSGKSFTIYSGVSDINQLNLNLIDYNFSSGLYLLNIQYGSTNTSHKLMITK